MRSLGLFSESLTNKPYLALIRKIVTEYAGNERVKFVPSPSTAAVTGTIFAGSVIEFVSSWLAELITTASPLRSTPAMPLSSMRTVCAAPALFTTFKKMVPAMVSRVALKNSVGTRRGGGGALVTPPRPEGGGCHSRVGRFSGA